MSLTVYWPKFHLSKCNGSWAISIKQNLTSNFQPPSTFVFWVFTNMVQLRAVHPLKICQNTTFHGPMVQVLHPHQKFERPIFWNCWSYGIRKYGVDVTFSGMAPLLNFTKNVLIGSYVIREGTQTDRQTEWRYHKPNFPFYKKLTKNKHEPDVNESISMLALVCKSVCVKLGWIVCEQ
jgi:hypothetical protein